MSESLRRVERDEDELQRVDVRVKRIGGAMPDR